MRLLAVTLALALFIIDPGMLTGAAWCFAAFFNPQTGKRADP